MDKNNDFLKKLVIGACAIFVIFALSYVSIKKNSSVGNNENKKTQSSSSLIGKTAPNFSLSDINGKNYSLENLRGKNVVLFFSEGLMCYPACWDQIAAFGKDNRLASGGAVVLSIIADPKNSWQQAIDKMPELAKATVVFDSDTAVSNKYGMLTMPSSMHYGYLPGHTYVVIDKQGVIRDIIDDPYMAINNDRLFNEITNLK